jgi:serine/threonine protein kinase
VERIGLAPGAEIGGYTVVAPLGAGGMGTVYRAVDGGGNEVALKLLHPDPADSAARARLLREVAALQRLRHPAVAAVLDAETDSTEAFLVTELVDGTDLERLVAETGPLDADELVALASGLRDALRAIHDAGVVHRDLKPSNVVMTAGGPVLIDFGLAQGESDARLTSTGLVAGTPGYLAPELLDGDDPSESADWWGWAALLVFAATGRPPFGSGRATTVLARSRAGKPDLTGLGQRTRTAIRGALAPDAGGRTSPDDVVAALELAAAEGDRSPQAARADGEATGRQDDEAETAVLTGADAMGTTAMAIDAPADGSAGTVAAVAAVGGQATATASPTFPPPFPTPAPTAILPGSRDGQTRVGNATASGLANPAPVGEAGPAAISGSLDDNVLVGAAADDLEDEAVADELDDDWDDDPEYEAVEWIEDDLDASSGAPGEETGYLRPAVPGRWVTQVALGALVVACGARRPGTTLLVAMAFFLVARVYGSTVEAMHGRREKHGVRASDPWVALATVPWHVLRAVAGIVPSVLVAASSLVIVIGVAWWFVGDGRWTIGGNLPGQELTGTTAGWLAGLAVLLALLLVWFGPLSRMTRVGTRRLLEVVSPRRLGALVIVLLILAVAWAVTTRTLHGDPIVWTPLPVPTVPAR